MLISKSKTCIRKQWAPYTTLQNAPQSSTNSGVWTLVLSSKVAKAEYVVLMTLNWLLCNKYAWRFENWYQSRRILWITAVVAAAHWGAQPAAAKNLGHNRSQSAAAGGCDYRLAARLHCQKSSFEASLTMKFEFFRILWKSPRKFSM
jgi:hypothetical protein